MSEIDLSTWLTKQHAADQLGVSTKAIERWVQAGKLPQRFRRQAGTPDVAIYCPEDVADLAASRQRTAPAPFLVPGQPVGSNGNGHRPSNPESTALKLLDQTPSAADLLQVIFAAAVQAVSQTSTSQTSVTPESQKLFLTIPEAARWTGLSPTYLRTAIATQRLPAIKDRVWKMRRTDLEAL